MLVGRLQGKTDISQGDKAEELILQGIDILDELKLKPMVLQGYFSLAEFYAETGQREKALEALKKAEAEFKDMGMDYRLRKTREVLARVVG